MRPQYILVRFGEVTLKGRNRTRFEQQLVKDMKRKLEAFPKSAIEHTFGRALIALNGEAYEGVSAALKRVFGIYSFSPVLRTDQQLENIREAALAVMKQYDPEPRTFKVTARRADKSYPHDSQKMNHLVGGYVLKNMPGLKVDVREPEVQLWVEIRPEGVFVYSQIEKGLKGFPAGSNGKGMLMLSGGIDSPVAGWLAMKRGLRVEAVHFHSYPYTSERAKQKVIDLARTLADYVDEVTLHLVPFTDIQVRLKQESNDNLLITLMRRIMFRITEKLAHANDAKAIVTGENLGQVASQTLSSLYAIEQVTTLPILRPLIMMEKEEIIRISEQIGTYETSILPYEDCCTVFLPKSPSTNPNMKVIRQLERSMDWLDDYIDQAIEAVETKVIRPQEQKLGEWERLF
ncbi:tRNA 4-thiouridine(8) synthase ThiI [Xylanibacillus composti]|uniref:Probable tRNA sulfurtransferase n=1 Tax=Xylanibacillus composti TaxID=1572762 RepID=A0A8J4GZ99_9BACL|nr:tRNA uracil 4-sulfurtransferase ThiI [Xylanibacillus composti]MDT9724398.1 tRNA 4-thiouridine(8) synthase ThiI [Xylanibacillus composti]GIQ67993.1 putative tRNA sulfurtransferase [Xylanibacillus composti]